MKGRTPMPRNLVICFDGTSNEFGTDNTNVVRLAQVLDRSDEIQTVFYDPGVGTMPQPGFVSWIGKKWSVLTGLAFGAGLTANVADAYEFLMAQYEPGDQIFLFGFSRGAYTARALAGVLYQFGLLPRGATNLVPYVMKMAKEINSLGDAAAAERYWNVCREFGATFARPAATSGFGARPVKIRFVGVWDTVSSVGFVWDPKHFAFTAHNASIEIFRQAISIDEHRAFFRQNRFFRSDAAVAPRQDVVETWFPGVHCDVGGGYPLAESGMWEQPFVWMVEEARRAGLRIDTERLSVALAPPTSAPSGWMGAIHESLTPGWWLAEFFPKMGRANRKGWRFVIPINLFKRRTVEEGARIHRTALERIRRADLNYRPRNLTPAFIERVLSLSEVPDVLAYSPG